MKPLSPLRSGRLPSSDGRNVNLCSIQDKNRNSSTWRETKENNIQNFCICIKIIIILLIIIIIIIIKTMCPEKWSLQDSIKKHFNKHRFLTNFLCVNS